MLSCSIVLLALLASAQGRAVNISNTWVLPEEGFPVFYRYFRDRISWYEADAVCQFHHANLVTVDTTAQYDAVRAYLKELDISSAVWVGLIRSNPDGDFTWTDYRGLSGDGYWSAAPDARAAPLCAAADPAADYRWEARACGGPTVASFICELPVPQWALGNEGCMVRALPALTVLYLPESAAVQLTADCGLAGVKKVQCTGNVQRENLLKNLSCNEDEDLSTSNPISSGSSIWTTSEYTYNNTNDVETTSDLSTDQDMTTEHTSEVDKDTTTPVAITLQKHQTIITKLSNNYLQKNINLDLIHSNNLQSNDIPKLANSENFLTLEQSEKLEDEKHMHHKMLHDELAKHGNFETIFTQPTDHFVPPLVMAKAKISDDMTVLSLAEKHAQQLADQQRYVKHYSLYNENAHLDTMKHNEKSTTEEPNKVDIIDKPLVMSFESVSSKNSFKKDKLKTSSPKKYKDKYDDPKGKNIKLDSKLAKLEKFTAKSTMLPDTTTKTIESTTTQRMDTVKNKLEDPVELTVLLKEPEALRNVLNKNVVPDTTTLEIMTTTEIHTTEPPKVTKDTSTLNYMTTPQVTNKLPGDNEKSNGQTGESSTTVIPVRTLSTKEIPTDVINKTKQEAMKDIDLNHEIIKITIVNDDDDDLSPTQTVFVLTTLIPELKETVKPDNKLDQQDNEKYVTGNVATTESANAKISSPITTTPQENSTLVVEIPTVHVTTNSKSENVSVTSSARTKTENITTTENIPVSQINETKTDSVQSTTLFATTADPVVKEKTEVYNITEMYDVDSERNFNDTEDIDDLNSPLLSAANEPVHRPNRSRRPQTPPNRLNKFNPFRILG